MSLDELLAWARGIVAANELCYVPPTPTTLNVARAIIALLGVEHPCGWGAPYACELHDGCVFDDCHMRIDEARWRAVMTLRAADAAERKARQG